MNNKAIIGLLVLLAALGGYLVALHSAGMNSARAQASARGLICRVPQGRSGDTPIVLVDTESQRLVVYEYDVSANSFELAAIRPYTYDVQAGPYNNQGPTVREVQMSVQQQKRSLPQQ
jgi:hypothetical protein